MHKYYILLGVFNAGLCLRTIMTEQRSTDTNDDRNLLNLRAGTLDECNNYLLSPEGLE